MSREIRTIRPYRGLGRLERVLDEARLRFGSKECAAGSAVTVDLDMFEFLSAPVVIEWAPEFEAFQEAIRLGCEEADIPPASAQLAVIASTSYLKRSSIVYRHDVDRLEALQPSVDLAPDGRAEPFRAVRHGFTVDAFVLLSRPLEEQPLRPWRRGTWLAHTRFTINTDFTSVLFTPIPLDDEQRARLGLPAKTLRYIDMGEHDPLESYADQVEKPKLYVDKDVLGELGASASSPSGVAVQIELALDFMSAVIYDAARRPELGSLTFEDLEESLLGRVLVLAAGPGSKLEDRETLLRLVESDPPRVIAYLEHIVEARKSMLDALHREA